MKKKLLDNLTTIFAVTAITLLVWLWAESRNIVQDKLPDVRVRFVSSQADEPLRITVDGKSGEKADEQTVSVTYRASRGEESQLLDAISKMGTIMLPVHEGDTVVSLKTLLSESEVFKPYVVNIVSTDPASAEVTVLPLVTKIVPVKVKANGPIKLEATAEPSEVAVTLPGMYASQLTEMTAYLQQEVYGDAEENVPQSERGVPLSGPYWFHEVDPIVNPSTVQVNFTVTKQTEKYTLPTVPIYVSAAPSLLQRYEINLPEDQQVLKNVELEGPADVIGMIKRGEKRIVAEIRPTAAELEGGIKYVALHINTPDQVKVISPLPQIPVTVVVREGSGAVQGLGSSMQLR
ncbi:YbbR-like domain-containing protein [Poriferisphaera corsica]|nr:hypothetical protein [Poriferisphaera corsica]